MKTLIRILIFTLLLAPFIGVAQVNRSANAGATILSASEINTAVFIQKENKITAPNLTCTKNAFVGTPKLAVSNSNDLSYLSDFEMTATGANAFSISMPSTIDANNAESGELINGTISINNTSPAYMEGTTFIVKLDARFEFSKNNKKGSYTTNPFEVILNQE